MLPILGPVIQALLKNSDKKTPSAQASVVADKPRKPSEAELAEAAEIDWSNPKAKISKFFTVHDAVYLPSWESYHRPSEEEKARIVFVAKKMDAIREFLNQPIAVHVWCRPAKASIPGSKWDGRNYNRYVYETFVWKHLSEERRQQMKEPNSAHVTGEGVDWSVVGKRDAKSCAEIRKLLVPKLEEFGIRMEDNAGAWIHIDVRPVVNRRFFKP